MSLSDPIGDMLARIKNAQVRNHNKVSLPSSKFKAKIADVLKSEGYIIDYKINDEKKPSIEINLKVLDELEKILVIKNVIATQKNGLLKNKSFLVTGKLNGISRAEVKSLIEENSGITVSTVSNKLKYLITGEKPTKRKVESARELKIKIINQDEFLRMLNKTS